MRTAILASALVATGAFGAARAYAHGGQPAVAWVNDPVGVGVVVDETFTFTWVDFDASIPTGTATIDFHYSARRPPAFLRGDIHPQLEGDPIVQGIWEKDQDNTYTWDTSQVPAGSYYIWSIVTEPPEEIQSPQIVSFSPGVLTVAHPGDPLHPSVLLTTPESDFTFADTEHVVRWLTFDPDGSGRVRLEAGTSSMGEDLTVIAQDLEASVGEFAWNTTDFPDGDYQVRATITDARGLSFSTFSQFILQISHAPSSTDAGITDRGVVSTPDAGPVVDSGAPATPEPSSCRCAASPAGGRPFCAGLIAFGLLSWARGRRRTASRSARR